MSEERPAPGEEQQEQQDDAEPTAHLGHAPSESNTSDEPEGDDGGEVDVEYVELAKIHNVQDRGAARLVKATLEDAQIPCVIEDDASETLDGIVGSHLDGIDIFVPMNYAGKARAVLAEQGIAAGVDKKRVEQFYEQRIAPAAQTRDGAACAAAARELSKESRDFRVEVLVRLAKLGSGGLDCARALLRSAMREPDDDPLVMDIPTLVDAGQFGPKAAIHLVGDLAALEGDAQAAVRRRVAAALGRLRAAGAPATLITLLQDKDASVRDEALESLYALSGGDTFDFDPDVDPAQQEEAVVKWREWARDNPQA